MVIQGFQGELAVRRDDSFLLKGSDITAYTATWDQFASASSDGIVHVDGDTPWSSKPGSRVHAMTWAAGTGLVVAGRSNGVMDTWTRSGAHVSSIQAHDVRIIDLHTDPSSGHIVSVDRHGAVQWWEPGRLTAEPQPILTNYRTCHDTQRAVPVLPFPEADVQWASATDCDSP